MTEQEIKTLVSQIGADGIYDLVDYLVVKGVITTRQKIARDNDASRGWIEHRMRTKYYRSIPIYKYATLIIDHERITRDTEETTSPEESAQ